MKKRISVAMATYNGAKYIEKQLRSILGQTVPPHEIIVSDDGSKDGTLQIVHKIAQEYSGSRTEIQVLTDNPRHGFCGNFEWAIKHTTGDYIFLCDQDDVWLPTKVEEVTGVFEQNPLAKCVFHDAVLVNEQEETLEGSFNDGRIDFAKVQFGSNKFGKLDRDTFLERTVCLSITNGMVMCIERQLLAMVLPFPKIPGAHDQWLAFCAVCKDQCYYLDEVLTQYRLHGTNTAGRKLYRGEGARLKARIGKILKRAMRIVDCTESARLGEKMIEKLEEEGLTDTQAYITAGYVRRIGLAQLDAARGGRIVGAFKLIKLYCTSMRYRRSGTASFLYQLMSILLHSKKARRAVLDR